MDVTTRCPACGSLFSGAQDQLQRSDGWVRCADCRHVFDATAQPAMEASVVALEREASDAAVPFAAVPRAASADSAPVTIPGSAPPAPPAPAPRSAEPAVEATPPDLDPAAVPEPRFVRLARRRAFWQSPGVRAGLGLIALLLSVLLAAQWALHHRDRLAATQPALAPWLAKACGSLACELAPVRHLEAIVIESTALVRGADSAYAFDIVLKNVSSIPLAMPALELTLTRWDDAVLVRRVFLPEELPDAPALLPARGLTTMRLPLSLVLEGDLPMAGYRALVFYP